MAKNGTSQAYNPSSGVSTINKMWREHHEASIEKMDKVIKKKKKVGKAKRAAYK